MSTALRILESEQPGGRLRRFVPAFVGREREARKVTMVRELFEWLDDGCQLADTAELKQFARSHFAHFVVGGMILVPLFMKRVEDRRRLGGDPFQHGVWSVRLVEEPQYRFFGMFALTDWFLVMSKMPREGITEEVWHAQIDACRKIWSELFGAVLPIIGNNEFAYIRENVEVQDDRW